MNFRRSARPAWPRSRSLPRSPAQPAQAPAARRPRNSAPTRFRAHVTFLADDLLEGRDTGSRGYDIAARYVATQFEALGLQAGRRQRQLVPAGRVRPLHASAARRRSTVGGRAFTHGREMVMRAEPRGGGRWRSRRRWCSPATGSTCPATASTIIAASTCAARSSSCSTARRDGDRRATSPPT